VSIVAFSLREKNPDGAFSLDDCSGVRPYGVSLLIAGWDSHRGQSLYQVDPSGSFWAWKASAIGKNMVNAKTFLEKR
jgi:20S proteasome alpha/beta subunit